MTTIHHVKRIMAGVLLSSGLAMAGLGLGAGAAEATTDPGPHHWCPGQDMRWQAGGPGVGIDWDMGVCHTWWYVANGQGNVGGPPADALDKIWDGDNPPPPPPPGPCIALFIPVPCPPNG